MTKILGDVDKQLMGGASQVTKFCSNHEIFTTEINNSANLECFTFLCHENLELYGTFFYLCWTALCIKDKLNTLILQVVQNGYQMLYSSSHGQATLLVYPQVPFHLVLLLLLYTGTQFSILFLGSVALHMANRSCI